jgi:Matrixin
MSRARRVGWIIGLASAVALACALAVPAGAAPPPWSPPGAGSSSATEIALCCTWGPGINDGVSYAIVGAPDTGTADAIVAGVEAWENAIGDADVHFDRVTSAAEVTIRFKRGGGTVAGSTSRTTSGGFITGASMSISGKAFGSTNSGAQLTTVTAHEWGHVLGLNHANGTGLLMSPTVDPSITTIQACDLGAAEYVLGWRIAGGSTPIAPQNTYEC